MIGEFKIGSVVLSKAGHDSGDYFVIVEIVNDDYVKVVDGRLRKLAKPKLKKTKHLKALGIELSIVVEMIKNGTTIHDKTIKSALRKVLTQ